MTGGINNYHCHTDYKSSYPILFGISTVLINYQMINKMFVNTLREMGVTKKDLQRGRE
jgi:hypothetical protein